MSTIQFTPQGTRDQELWHLSSSISSCGRADLLVDREAANDASICPYCQTQNKALLEIIERSRSELQMLQQIYAVDFDVKPNQLQLQPWPVVPDSLVPLMRTYDAKIAALQQKCGDFIKEISVLNGNIDQVMKDNEDLIALQRENTREIATLKGKLHESALVNDELRQTIENLKKEKHVIAEKNTLLSQDLRATKIEVERVRKDYEKCKDDLEASMKQNIELIDRIRKHERDLDDLNNHCRKVENYREEVNRRNSELVSTLEKYESELHAWQQRCKHMETLYGDLQGKNQIPSNPFVGWRPVLYPSQPVTPLRLDDSNLLHQRHPSADDGVAELRRIWAYGRR